MANAPERESALDRRQSRAADSGSHVNSRILAVMSHHGLAWWALLVTSGTLYFSGLVLFGFQTYRGLGIAGYQSPVLWGVYIVTFVFWIGIAHAGTLISAILYLFRAKWRGAINRLAEAITVIAVLTALQLLAVHVGRIWKAHFMLPYPNQRGLWVNFKSPLVWDTVAISTYATISLLFFYVGLLPDLAIARDRSQGVKRAIYGALALGWTGSHRHWRHHTKAVLLLSGLATPLVLSVHSVVSWDFAMSLVPGWHGTIFAPYFVAGAIFSGFAMVLTVLIPLRRIYGLESLITDYHFENMSRFLLFTSTILLYSYACEYFVAWYSAVEFEQTSFCLRLTGPYAAATFIMIFCNTILPQVLWVRRVRTHLPSLFVLSVLINIGMWFERYVIIVTGLSRKFAPSAWGIYLPSPIELGVLVSSFGFFCFMTLLFIKTLPMIAISEIKEIEIRRRQAKAAETTKDVRHRQATLTRRTLS